MIPFGPWRPDAAGINTQVCIEARNVLPSEVGYEPVPRPVPNIVDDSMLDDDGSTVLTDDDGSTILTDSVAGTAIPSRCYGAVSFLKNDRSAAQFAGTATKLYKSSSGQVWDDVTRASGGDYATPAGERWRFVQWGAWIIATNYQDAIQRFDTAAGTKFVALGGSPPRARYIAVVRDQVILGGINGNENRVGWCGTNNAEFWTFGSGQNCDYQDFPNGGPIMGIVGGTVGYVFQPMTVTRMVQQPGSATIYQFDEVQGAKGLSAPDSLVKVGDVAYYKSTDGFYKFNTVSGAQSQIGTSKWRQWVLDDIRAGTDLSILGAFDPEKPLILWAYISRSNTGTVPDKIIAYNWALDEATILDIPAEALASWVTLGVTLDTMNSFGNMETLPYSLDSPFWKGGASLIGIFGEDHQLSTLSGDLMEAQWTTADGQLGKRMLIKATRPYVDTAEVEVSVHMRERDADPVNFTDSEFAGMEDTGLCGAWASGNIARARIWIPSGAVWTKMKGIETNPNPRGSR